MKRIIKDKPEVKPIKNKLKKVFKKSLNNLRNFSLLIIIFQIIVILSIAISEPVALRIILGKLSRRILWSFDTLEIKDYGNYLKDFLIVLNPFSRELDRVDITINFKNLQGLDCSREFNSYSTTNRIEETKKKCGKYWFNGSLSHNNRNYKIKIRSKGDRDIHYRSFDNMSFKVDIKGEDRLKGMEEFAIQTPMIRNYTTELFAAKLMRNEDIIAPRNHYIKFYINGEYKGIRHIEEGFSRELIEFNKRRYGPLFSLEENIDKTFKGAFFDLSDSNYWKKNLSQKYLPIQARTILEESKIDNEYIEKYFDLDKWAKYFAIIDSFRLWHASMPKSVKYFLNPVTGLIEPAFFDGHTNSSRGLDNYNFYHLLNSPEDNNTCEYICDPKDNFYRNFFGTYSNPNSKFYIKYIRNLERITEKEYFKNNIYPVWESLGNERGSLYKEFWRIDRIHNPGIMPHIAPWELIQKRLNTIRTNLKKANSVKPEILIKDKIGIIGVRNKFSDVPQIINLKCLDNNFETGDIVLPKNKFIDFTYNPINECNKNRIIYSIDNFNSVTNLQQGYLTDYEINEINNFSKLGYVPKKDLSKNMIIFKKGNHNIKNTLEIDNKLVIFKDDANICLEKNSILHIKNSEVIFSENPAKPVLLSNCINDIGGSVVIEDSNVNINNLNVKNLSKPSIKLRSLDGGVNLINSEVKISKFISLNSKSEDAINFINSNVKAKKIEIYNSISDGVDSDFSIINIKDIYCKNIGNDCFDSSFTKGLLQQIKGQNVNDKVLSIGERSEIKIDKTYVIDSEIGIVVKDASKVKIKNLNFENVKLPVATYIKKEEFGKPEVYIGKISPENTNDFLISLDTIFTIGDSTKKTSLSSKYIEGILYGNQFGVKTKR